MTAEGGTGSLRGVLITPLALFAVSFLLCLSFCLYVAPPPIADDSLEYFRLAENLSRGRGFSLDGATPAFYRPPLFPALLGGWFRLTGSRTLLSAQIYQSLCIAFSTVFAWLLAGEILSRRGSAGIAAALVAVHPSLWTYAVFVRQEPTILLLTTAAAWRTVRWLRRCEGSGAAATGLLWGVATLAKSVTLFMPALLLAFGIPRSGKDRRIPMTGVAVAVTFFVLAIAPWTIRNYVHLHRLVPVNDQGAGMLEWTVAHGDPEADEGKGIAALLAAQLQTKDPSKGLLGGGRFIAELDGAGISGEERRRKLWGYVLSHKRYFLVQRIRHAIFFAAPGVDWWIHSGRLGTGEPQKNPAYWAFALVFAAPLYLFFAWRCLQVLRGKAGPAVSFLVLFYLCYWGVYATIWGEPRFSLPVYPILAALAPWDRLFPKT